MIVYGTDQCPDCLEAKQILEEKRIPFSYRSIRDLSELKMFLSYRDDLLLFDQVQEECLVGIPLFIIDEFATLDLDTALRYNECISK